MSRMRLEVAVGSLAAVSLVLSACGGGAAPTPQVIEKEKIVEKIVTSAPVVQTQVVEKVVQAPTATPLPKSKVLRVNVNAGYPDNLDPQKASFVHEIGHLRLLYQGLTYVDNAGVTKPGAAESWKYNDAGDELTFNLKKGLKYSDGTPLNAKRFEYSIQRNINPDTAGQYAFVTNDYIVGAQAWSDAAAALATAKDDAAKKKAQEELDKAKADVKASVIALDAAGQPCKAGADGYKQEDCLTLKVKFNSPTPFWHTIAGLWIAYPAKEENIKAGKEQWWNSSKYQIGNGPMVLKTLEPSVKAQFVPNANFNPPPGAGIPKYNLEYSYNTDSAVVFNAFKNGEFDLAVLAPEDLKTVDADAELAKQKLIYSGKCTTGLQMNQKFQPFEDQKVREAVAQAINRDAYVKDIFQGLATKTLTWIPSGTAGHVDGEKRNDFNVDNAKKLLAESKYPTQDKVKDGKIIMAVSNTPRNVTRGEWFVQQLKNNLGWNVTLDKVDPTEFTARQKKGDLPMFLGGWCEDFPDPTNWLSTYFKSTSQFASRIGYVNKDNDKVMTTADATTDNAKRMELYGKAQDTIINDAPIAFLYNAANSYLVKPYVTGVAPSGQDTFWPGDNSPWTIDVNPPK